MGVRMDTVVTIVLGAIGLAVGIAAGLAVGSRVRERPPWVYWLCNALAFVDGVVVSFLGLQFGQWGVVVAGIALIGGGLTGLKYGYGRVVGVWRVHDDVMGNDRDMPR
ncbi:MAG: hypothetical protein Q8K99_11080 [Actinomycetota bacterium]|nr:hypothetical protein [Actinomycetota bacterium]